MAAGTLDRSRLLGAAPVGAAAPLACGACLLAGAAYVAVVDPSEGGGLTACPIRAATGQWCPGCGLTRATHHLARGDLLQALSFNMLVPFVLAGLAIAWFSWWRIAIGRRAPAWVTALRVRTYVVVGLAVTAFVVVRNLPGGAWLRGGP